MLLSFADHRPIKTMTRGFYLTLIACLSVWMAGACYAQIIPYKVGSGSWDPDQLGNQRAVVRVSGEGKTAVALVPWRCRTVTPDQQIIVVDGQTGRQIPNVKTEKIGPEAGTVYFEPVSGKGDYYIYFLPYKLKKPENYPSAIYSKESNTASGEWMNLLTDTSLKRRASVRYIESFNALNNLYPMEVIATRAETEKLISDAGKQPYLIFAESRMYPVSMATNLPQRWVGKANETTLQTLPRAARTSLISSAFMPFPGSYRM